MKLMLIITMLLTALTCSAQTMKTIECKMQYSGFKSYTTSYRNDKGVPVYLTSRSMFVKLDVELPKAVSICNDYTILMLQSFDLKTWRTADSITQSLEYYPYKWPPIEPQYSNWLSRTTNRISTDWIGISCNYKQAFWKVILIYFE